MPRIAGTDPAAIAKGSAVTGAVPAAMASARRRLVSWRGAVDHMGTQPPAVLAARPSGLNQPAAPWRPVPATGRRWRKDSA